jgi:phosphohistidine phosphatase
MQRHLLIMRHAQAEEIQRDQSDKSRTLTMRGKQEVIQVAAYLLSQQLSIDAIYCSSAVRTQQTAALLADVLRFPKEKIENHDELYNSSLSTYVDSISTLNDTDRKIVVIGHNPAVTQLTEHFLGKPIESFATAGICELKFDCNSWREIDKRNGHLHQFISPELINKLHNSK